MTTFVLQVQLKHEAERKNWEKKRVVEYSIVNFGLKYFVY
jgi:hypothetical protein